MSLLLIHRKYSHMHVPLFNFTCMYMLITVLNMFFKIAIHVHVQRFLFGFLHVLLTVEMQRFYNQ